MVSVVWDCVERWHLRHRHRGTTRLAADCGGLLSLAGATRWGTTSEDGASDFLVLLLWRRWLDVRVKQRDEVNLQRRLGGLRRSEGAGHLCSPLQWRLLKRILGVELCGGCGMAPVRRRERWSPTAEAARPPRVVLLPLRLQGDVRVY